MQMNGYKAKIISTIVDKVQAIIVSVAIRPK